MNFNISPITHLSDFAGVPLLREQCQAVRPGRWYLPDGSTPMSVEMDTERALTVLCPEGKTEIAVIGRPGEGGSLKLLHGTPEASFNSWMPIKENGTPIKGLCDMKKEGRKVKITSLHPDGVHIIVSSNFVDKDFTLTVRDNAHNLRDLSLPATWLSAPGNALDQKGVFPTRMKIFSTFTPNGVFQRHIDDPMLIKALAANKDNDFLFVMFYFEPFNDNTIKYEFIGPVPTHMQNIVSESFRVAKVITPFPN